MGDLCEMQGGIKRVGNLCEMQRGNSIGWETCAKYKGLGDLCEIHARGTREVGRFVRDANGGALKRLVTLCEIQVRGTREAARLVRDAGVHSSE